MQTPTIPRRSHWNTLLPLVCFQVYAEKYAADQNAFFADYALAHQKLSELGSQFDPPEVHSHKLQTVSRLWPEIGLSFPPFFSFIHYLYWRDQYFEISRFYGTDSWWISCVVWVVGVRGDFIGGIRRELFFVALIFARKYFEKQVL